jgi:hypothetical protein
LPIGIDIEVVDACGANFMLENGKAKFIWMHLPNVEEVKLKYILLARNNANKKSEINYIFHYTSGQERLSYSYSSFIEVIGHKEELSLKSIDRLIKERDFEGLQFKVQLGAFSKALSSEEIRARFGEEKITVEKIGSFYKYTVGPFKDYDTALAYRNKCAIEGAFLVLYFVDKRLSLGEAFKMIKP